MKKNYDLIGLSYANTCLPLALRLLITSLPPTVAIRALKPILRLTLLLPLYV